MTQETVILVGRDSAAAVGREHADRLRDRGIVDTVRSVTYETEPALELAEALSALPGDRVYAVPTCFAHTHETLTAVPRALQRVPGDVRYCAPLGKAPAITRAIRERARVASDADALLLIALGNSRDDHGRDAAAFHAARLRDEFAEVKTAYLLQSPAVECARYALNADHAVACPLFLAECDATRGDVPTRLELDRGGIDYAGPLGAHPAVTDAVAAAVERERVLAESETGSPGTDLVANARRVATDGRGDG